MSETGAGVRAEARHGTLLGGAVLAAVLGTAVAVALALGAGRPRWPEAVAFAAGVSVVGGLGGWLAARLPPANPALAVAAALGSTALRTLPALAGLAWLAGRGAPLREAGADGLLVGFYLLLLATAILLHIMVAPGAGARRTRGPR